MSYKASIIIPTYNRESLLKETLLSLEKNNICKSDFEVIVCDDGSSDNTERLVSEFSRRLNIVYKFQEDKGFRAGKARNMGIEVAKGDICIFVDGGIIVKDDFIEQHLSSHLGDKDVVIGDIVGFDQLNSNKDIFMKLYNRDDINETIKCLIENGVTDIRNWMYKVLGEEIKKWPAPWVILWSGNISIKKAFLIEIGMFDEWYNTWGGEDTDLGINLFLNGGNYLLNRNAIGIDFPHEKLNNFKQNMNLAMQEQRKKRHYMYRKYKSEEVLAYKYIDTHQINQYLIEMKKFKQKE